MSHAKELYKAFTVMCETWHDTRRYDYTLKHGYEPGQLRQIWWALISPIMIFRGKR